MPESGNGQEHPSTIQRRQLALCTSSVVPEHRNWLALCTSSCIPEDWELAMPWTSWIAKQRGQFSMSVLH